MSSITNLNVAAAKTDAKRHIALMLALLSTYLSLGNLHNSFLRYVDTPTNTDTRQVRAHRPTRRWVKGPDSYFIPTPPVEFERRESCCVTFVGDHA